MKVMLIIPPNYFWTGDKQYVTFPLGIAYIAAVLEKAGHELKVLDCLIEDPVPKKISEEKYRIGISDERIRNEIQDFNPDIVGLTASYSVQFMSSLDVARISKDVNKNVKTVFGGSHVSGATLQAIKEDGVDFIVIGESEEIFLRLLEALEGKIKLGDVNGLGYKIEGKIKINHRGGPKLGYIYNLDEMPFPARHLFDMQKYFDNEKEHAGTSKRFPHTTMVTSRGCPEVCSFCSIHEVWGYKWRSRSARNVVDEIEMLVNDYGIKEVHFEDDNLGWNRQRLWDICEEIIRRGIDITWTVPNGIAVKSLDKELLAKMKKSGCYKLFLAIESGNDYILNTVIRKFLDLDKVREVAKATKELGIERIGFFVLGMPGETKETVQDTIDFANELDLDEAQFAIASPYPGTPLYRICKEKGYLIDETNYEKLKPRYANLNTEFLKAEEVIELRNKAYLSFHLTKLRRNPIKYLANKQNRSFISRNANSAIKSYTNKIIKVKAVS